MRRRSLSWLASLMLASGLLALGVCSAAAASVELPNSNWRSVWRSVEFVGGFGTVRCSLTLEGSFSVRTFEPTRGLLVGYVTRASVSSCPAGSASVLTASLPWHVTYREFTGTLPTIETMSFDVVGAAIQVREPTFGITCLMTSTAGSPMTLNGATGEPGEEGIFPFTSFRIEERSSIPCGSFSATVHGTGTPTVAGGTEAIHLHALGAPGMLSVTPPRGRIARGNFENMALRNTAAKGSGRITITEIRISDMALFEIRDEGGCRRRPLEVDQECTISVRALAERSMANVIVEYLDPSRQTRTVMVESS